jgi:hypothetical protein
LALDEDRRRVSDATLVAARAILERGGGRSDNLECAVDALVGGVVFGVLRWLYDRAISKTEPIGEPRLDPADRAERHGATLTKPSRKRRSYRRRIISARISRLGRTEKVDTNVRQTCVDTM